MLRPQALPPGRPTPPHIRVLHSAAARPTPLDGPTVPNAIIGVLIFLGAETMLFAGLVSVLLVLRANSVAWPPPGQPRLPTVVTAVNTVLLLISGYTMQRALRAIRHRDTQGLVAWLWATALLGTVFLVFQGAEWVRLVNYGLHVTSGTYGATFYTLIGCHGLHVLVGIGIVSAALWQAAHGRCSKRNHVIVEVCRLYWTFVVGVWPVLYALVYLM